MSTIQLTESKSSTIAKLMRPELFSRYIGICKSTKDALALENENKQEYLETRKDFNSFKRNGNLRTIVETIVSYHTKKGFYDGTDSFYLAGWDNFPRFFSRVGENEFVSKLGGFERFEDFSQPSVYLSTLIRYSASKIAMGLAKAGNVLYVEPFCILGSNEGNIAMLRMKGDREGFFVCAEYEEFNGYVKSVAEVMAWMDGRTALYTQIRPVFPEDILPLLVDKMFELNSYSKKLESASELERKNFVYVNSILEKENKELFKKLAGKKEEINGLNAKIAKLKKELNGNAYRQDSDAPDVVN